MCCLSKVLLVSLGQSEQRVLLVLEEQMMSTAIPTMIARVLSVSILRTVLFHDNLQDGP